MPKRMLQGVVVSDKQDKTVVVRVERRFTHPVMKRITAKTIDPKKPNSGPHPLPGRVICSEWFVLDMDTSLPFRA